MKFATNFLYATHQFDRKCRSKTLYYEVYLLIELITVWRECVAQFRIIFHLYCLLNSPCHFSLLHSFCRIIFLQNHAWEAILGETRKPNRFTKMYTKKIASNEEKKNEISHSLHTFISFSSSHSLKYNFFFLWISYESCSLIIVLDTNHL